MHGRTQVTGDPPPLLAHWVRKKKAIVETLNNVGNPTWCRHPLNPARQQLVCYMVRCLQTSLFAPTLRKGGGDFPPTVQSYGRRPSHLDSAGTEHAGVSLIPR